MLRPLTAALLLGATAACARTVAEGIPSSPTREARGFPGFDTSRYPGDGAMQAWRASSPYTWVGYYVQSPCHRDASWSGTRDRLERMGWGTAVIYVGQQAWEGAPDRAPSDTGAIICSRTLLSAAQGRADADDAIAKAAADGFPRGSVIYLDIEPMTTVPAAMRDYYRAWLARVREEGRYRPGVYVHRRNASEVHGDLRQVYGPPSSGEPLPVWIAGQEPGFTLEHAPREFGVEFARIWQGRVNFDETWGGVPLRIDANVADRRSPSAP